MIVKVSHNIGVGVLCPCLWDFQPFAKFAVLAIAGDHELRSDPGLPTGSRPGVGRSDIIPDRTQISCCAHLHDNLIIPVKIWPPPVCRLPPHISLPHRLRLPLHISLPHRLRLPPHIPHSTKTPPPLPNRNCLQPAHQRLPVQLHHGIFQNPLRFPLRQRQNMIKRSYSRIKPNLTHIFPIPIRNPLANFQTRFAPSFGNGSGLCRTMCKRLQYHRVDTDRFRVLADGFPLLNQKRIEPHPQETILQIQTYRTSAHNQNLSMYHIITSLCHLLVLSLAHFAIYPR